MIEVENLTKAYGQVTAVDHVSFSVNKGEILGFLGPNGAGKTTTMRILTGFMPATSGTARVAGFDVFSDSMEVRRHIGYLPEAPPVYPDMSVAGYLDFVARIKNDYLRHASGMLGIGLMLYAFMHYAGHYYVGGVGYFTSGTAATSTTTGSVVVTGGVHVYV